MRYAKSGATGTLMLTAFLMGCAVRTELTTVMGEPSKLTLGQARTLLEQTKKPVDRTRAYVELSDVLIRHIHRHVPRSDQERTREWLDQYQNAILSARDEIVASGRDAQRHPDGFMELEMTLRRHIRWLSDWRFGLVDEQREPIENTLKTASEVRTEMLDLLFPVVIQRRR